MIFSTMLLVCVNGGWIDFFARRLRSRRRGKQSDIFNTTNDDEIRHVNTVRKLTELFIISHLIINILYCK